jgi:mannose-6-phosphate isomerase-like protein (cupin superfamily)
MRSASFSLFVCLLAVLLSFPILLAGPPFALAEDAKPHAKVIPFESSGKDFQPLLSGPPETVTMKSGLVTLSPGKSVGKHSTGQHEEMLVILAGSGGMIFKDGSAMQIAANQALYCPPNTEHDVKNTGTGTLRYVYIVARTK